MCTALRTIAIFALIALLSGTRSRADSISNCDEGRLTSVAESLAELTEQSEKVQSKLAQLNEETKHQMELLEKLRAAFVNSGGLISPYPLIDVRRGESVASPPLPHRLPANCAEAVEQAGGNRSGIYRLQLPHTDFGPFSVQCLVDPGRNGSAWTVVQRRQDGSTNFYRDWHAYKHGFGFVQREYFVGLEKLHALTQSQLHELWIEMADFEGQSRYAKYNLFAVDDERAKYALNVLGEFSGDAGDSLRSHLGMGFTTRDVDNDAHSKNCAEMFTGAWWYNACHSSNLNGQYLGGTYGNDKYAKGIDWLAWHGHNYSLKYVHMAIRPIASKDCVV